MMIQLKILLLSAYIFVNYFFHNQLVEIISHVRSMQFHFYNFLISLNEVPSHSDLNILFQM